MKKLIILPKLCNCNGRQKKQWFVYYSVRDPQTGKMHRFRHYDGFTGLSELEKYDHARGLIEDYTTKLRSGWSPFLDDQRVIYEDHIDYKTVTELYKTRRAGNRTLRVVLSKFLDHKKPAISASTFQTYSSKARIFFLWTDRLGIQLNDIKAYSNAVILGFFHFLINEKQLSGRSVRKYAELLTAFFNFCIDRKYIRINPVYKIPRCTRINDNTARPIMRADVEIFKPSLAKDPQLWLAIQFMFYCALRPNHEAREMKIKEIDFIAGMIYVSRDRAKSRMARVVTIPRQFLLKLRQDYDLQKYDPELYIFGSGGHPGPVPIGKNTLGHRFNKIRDELKMPKEYKLYSWKHTAAVEVDEAKIPTKDLSRHYGHSSISVTDIYLRNKKPQLSEAIRDNYPDL